MFKRNDDDDDDDIPIIEPFRGNDWKRLSNGVEQPLKLWNSIWIKAWISRDSWKKALDPGCCFPVNAVHPPLPAPLLEGMSAVMLSCILDGGHERSGVPRVLLSGKDTTGAGKLVYCHVCATAVACPRKVLLSFAITC